MDTQPKLNETYLIYLECVLFLGEWSSLVSNKTNIRILAEYQLQKNIINTNIPPIISEFYITELPLRSWIFNKYAIQDFLLALDFLNSNKEGQEEDIKEIAKAQLKIKNLKSETLRIGFIVDRIEDYCTLYLLLLLRSAESGVKSYIIVYDATNIVKQYKDYCDDFIILDNVYHPLFKADQLKEYELDIIILLEDLCYEIYDNLTMRKINQLLAYKPAALQLTIPYNGLTRSEKINDYLILDSFIFSDENRALYQEKLVICNEKTFAITPEKFWRGLKTKDFLQLYRLNKMSEAELLSEITNYDFPEAVFFGNLSEVYKITENLFTVWMSILKKTENSKLILKFSNEIQKENFKINAEKNGVSADRLVFLECCDRQDKLEKLKFVDIYLDINYMNGEDNLNLALNLNIPTVCYSAVNDEEKPFSKFCLRFLKNSNLSSFGETLQEYENIALQYFNEMTMYKINLGFYRIKKLQLIKNLRVSSFFINLSLFTVCYYL